MPGPTYKTRVVPVDSDDGRTYTAECACRFTSAGWPQKKHATARIGEHTTEHDTAEPMRELVDFRGEHDLNGPVIDTVDFDDAEG